MTDHIDIFSIIFAIKDKISDNEFLELNNGIQKLIEENQKLKQEKRSIIRIIPSIDSENIHYRYESDEESSENEEEDEEEEEEEGQINICTCVNQWNFLDDNIRPIGELSNYFCLRTDETMRNCENFRKLMHILPLLENLFQKIDLPFAEESIEGHLDGINLNIIIRVLLSIINKMPCKRKKSIITFVLYDCLIRNIDVMCGSDAKKRFCETVLKKFEDFLEDSEFVQYAQEYNVNYTKWIDIMKNIS